MVLFFGALAILPLKISQESNEHAKQLSISYFEDQLQVATIPSILTLQNDAWQDIHAPEFGLSDSAFWLRAIISRDTNERQRILRISYSAIDTVEIWFFKHADLTAGEHSPSPLSYHILGDQRAFSERPVDHEQLIVDIPLLKEDVFVLLKASSDGSLKVPIEKWDKLEFVEFSALYKGFMGLFFGYILAMILSNFAIFAITKNVNFLIYTCYSLSVILGVASLHGFGFQFLWPNNLWLQEYSVVLFVSLTMMSILSLSVGLLNLKEKSLRLYKLHKSIIVVFGLIVLACFVLPYSIVLPSFLLILIVAAPIVFLSGLYIAFSGTLVHKLYCSSWAVLLFAGMMVALQSAGILNTDINGAYMLAVGGILEALLLSFSLAVKYNEQTTNVTNAKILAMAKQEEAISARDELIVQQTENELDLKNRIAERKIELSKTLYKLAERNQVLTALSSQDTLTGLMNRHYFDEHYHNEASRSAREKVPLAVAVIDIDFFKRVNDNYGHLCGDHCLTSFAATLKQLVKRPTDIICRYGGEEFVLVLPNTDAQGLSKILESVRLAAERKIIRFEGQKLSFTVSAGGCSGIISQSTSASSLFACADKMLYQAKNDGRNLVRVDEC